MLQQRITSVLDHLLDERLYVQTHGTLPSIWDELYGTHDAATIQARLDLLLRDGSRIRRGEDWEP
jgi:hypothetical protein